MEPRIAAEIAIHVCGFIFSFKKNLARNAVNNGVIASKNNVLATVVFRIEITDPTNANKRPIPPKISLRKDLKITVRNSDLYLNNKINDISKNSLIQR